MSTPTDDNSVRATSATPLPPDSSLADGNTEGVAGMEGGTGMDGIMFGDLTTPRDGQAGVAANTPGDHSAPAAGPRDDELITILRVEDRSDSEQWDANTSNDQAERHESPSPDTASPDTASPDTASPDTPSPHGTSTEDACPATTSPEAAQATPVHPEVTDPNTARPVTKRSWFRRVLGWPGAIAQRLFGLGSIITGVALLATVPVLQLLSLGYLLECAGRIARTGKLRSGMVGWEKAARAGSIVLGTWLVLWPARFVSEMWYSAQLIDPQSRSSRRWWVGLLLVTILTGMHVIWAWYRGGKLRHFAWPAPLRFLRELRQPDKYVRARDALWQYTTSLRLGYYFRLGFIGFVGTLAWLLLPVTLFIGSTTFAAPWSVLAVFFGSLLLALAVVHLPVLQVQFAADGQWRSLFDVRTAYRTFFRAPLACLIALIITLASALPLYLLKIELTPAQVAVLPSLVFVTFMLPTRWFQGWAVSRSIHRPPSRKPLLRMGVCYLAALFSLPVVALYIAVVFFTRYTSWYGVWSLFEQHAFLLPVPFLGT